MYRPLGPWFLIASKDSLIDIVVIGKGEYDNMPGQIAWQWKTNSYAGEVLGVPAAPRCQSVGLYLYKFTSQFPSCYNFDTCACRSRAGMVIDIVS